METLFIRKSLNGYFFLDDARGYHLGWFESIESAQKWCNENGYRFRVIN